MCAPSFGPVLPVRSVLYVQIKMSMRSQDCGRARWRDWQRPASDSSMNGLRGESGLVPPAETTVFFLPNRGATMTKGVCGCSSQPARTGAVSGTWRSSRSAFRVARQRSTPRRCPMTPMWLLCNELRRSLGSGRWKFPASTVDQVLPQPHRCGAEQGGGAER